MSKSKSKLLIIIYGHPENYPPTLNAISELSGQYNIKIVYRAHQKSDWDYPQEVQLIPDGQVITAQQQETLPTIKKILLFIRFCLKVNFQLITFRPQVVLMYDSLSIMAFYIASKISFKSMLTLWYHNHDVYEASFIRKYSLSWWALLVEKRLFSKLDIFSLPSLERKQFFPLEKLKGQFMFLPNFPSKKIYTSYFNPDKSLNDIQILFQGQIGEGHGIEELINMMPFSIRGLPIKLILRGHVRNDYGKWLKTQIETRQLQGLVEVHSFVPYKFIPELGSKCHIGLAVFKKHDIMNSTIGTASNKIYEYAALGLPILYFNTPYFTEYLGKYTWAKGINSDPDLIKNQITDIIDHYPLYAQAAYNEFIKELNFENYFLIVKEYLSKKN